MLNTKLLGSVSAAPSEFVEDVFSTYLYTGNGSTQSINNGIDVTGEGALVWLKRRDSTNAHFLFDTARGVGTGTQALSSNTTAAGGAGADIAFSSTGFDLTQSGANTNGSGATYASFTFRKAPKFFDVVTYTGNGSSSQTVAHNLGSQPGFIILKQTSGTSDWQAFGRKDATNYSFVQLNQTGSQLGDVTQSDLATSSVIKVGWLGTTWLDFNTNGQTYVAYLFAHDAGGFGTAGTDNVISCGSYTYSGGANPEINLGFEPQWVMRKRSDSTSNWEMVDIMRGMPNNTANAQPALQANLSAAESSTSMYILPTATGFIDANTAAATSTYIYMAIRRPMKPPTSGTEVFSPNIETSSTTPQTVTTGFPVDLCINTLRNGGFASTPVMDRLRGGTRTSYNFLNTASTAAESTGTGAGLGFDSNIGLIDNAWLTNTNAILWNFRRATGFFDVVCYTGTGSAVTFNHNLGVAPELLIFKRRDAAASWRVQSSALTSVTDSVLLLNATSAEDSSTANFYTTPTSTTFGFGTGAPTSTGINASGSTYVAYLFATLAGVSKVGSYTGTGATQTINCGFTGGARFVMIKRTNDIGNWYVWDTARGMVSGTDPLLALNNTDAEINIDAVFTTTGGFQIVNTGSQLNASGGSYIYLAIA